MYDLTHFTLRDMTVCGAALRQLGVGASSMEEVAQGLVEYLYDTLRAPQTGTRACSLIRFYKTHPYAELEPILQTFADRLLVQTPATPTMPCMTLLATMGAEPAWQQRRQSTGHQAIPLSSPELVAQLPMVAQLVRQFGLPLESVLAPDPTLLIDLEQKTYGVFYVPNAIASPYIPAQDTFVVPYGIQAVLGCGGLLPTGHLYAVIIFSTVPIPRQTAELFRSLALSIKVAILPFVENAVFARQTLAAARASYPSEGHSAPPTPRQLQSHIAALSQLLEVHEITTLEQTTKLEDALRHLHQQDLEKAHLLQELQSQAADLAQVNAALQHAKGDLEQRVTERTAALEQANTTLRQEITERRQAEECLKTFAAQLEQSNRELQDFAYVASHDLQEPLRKIQAFGDRLHKVCSPALGEQGRDYLTRMQHAAHRMQRLIRDLLSFSRVTTQAQPFVPVDLARVVQEVVTDLEVRLEHSAGRVDVDTLTTLHADPLQMRQLLQNLIGNALKFRRPDVPPVVRISGHCLAASPLSPAPTLGETAWYQIAVADNGIGFDEKYLDRIFAPFQRLHGRTEYEGTGIGLAICRKIVERHGGLITATSVPGRGTTFLVTLPLRHTAGGQIA
jgi:signal transduction histidine kinase